MAGGYPTWAKARSKLLRDAERDGCRLELTLASGVTILGQIESATDAVVRLKTATGHRWAHATVCAHEIIAVWR